MSKDNAQEQYINKFVDRFDHREAGRELRDLVNSEVRQVLDRLLIEQETFSDDFRHNQAVKVAAIEAERKRYE